MSSPRTETAARTDDMDKDKDKEKGTGLSAVQVAASALAAVSSAVLLSFFGVAGTLIGAALASVISTVGAAVYGTSLKKTNERLQRVMTGRQQAAAKASVATTEPAETRELVAATREMTAPTTAPTTALPASLDPRRAPARRFQPRWGRVAAYAAAVFFVAMGIVTGIELIGQKPVSAIVTDTDSTGGTTIGELTNASSSSDTTPTTPSTPATPTAPATTTAESSPTGPTETTEGGDESGPESESASSSSTGSSSQSSPSSSSTSRSSASPTRSSGAGSSSPAQGAVPTG